METHELRSQFAIDFLGELAAAGVQYAVQRNFEDITSGYFKDIDLIIPQAALNRILRILRSRNDVRSVKVVKGLSRSQLEIDLNLNNDPLYIDLDYQVTVINNRGLRPLSRLFAGSITYSDLDLNPVALGPRKINLLAAGSEFLLLKSHFNKKPKDIYRKRIAEYERQGTQSKRLSPILRVWAINLLRRYFLILQATPSWLIYRVFHGRRLS
jgi:hypothetical protein